MNGTATPNTDYTFQSLPYPVRSFGNLKIARYHIYSSRHQFITVEAETATDALRESKIAEPTRIVRDIPGREVLLDRKRVFENVAGAATAQTLADAGATPAAAPAAEAVPAAEAAAPTADAAPAEAAPN